jgi:hypothetical protein
MIAKTTRDKQDAASNSSIADNHTEDDLWRVAAKRSDRQVEDVADFENEVEANDWI